MKKLFFTLHLFVGLCLLPATATAAMSNEGVPPILANFVKSVEDSTFEVGKQTVTDFAAQVAIQNSTIRNNYNTEEGTDSKPVYTQERVFDKYAPLDLRKEVMDKIYFGQHVGGSSTSILLSPIRILPEWCTEEYRIVKAYYTDGSEEEVNEQIDKELDSYISLQALQTVKEIQVNVKASFPFDSQTINLNATNSTKDVEGGKISYSKINNNCVSIVLPKRYRLLEIQAQDAMGNFLESKTSMQTAGMSFDAESKFYTNLEKDLNELHKKVEKNKYKSKEALVSDCKKLTTKYKGLILNDNNLYITTFFHGNVDRVALDVASQNAMEIVDFLIYPETKK